MGNYERTSLRIQELERTIEEKKALIASLPDDEEALERLYMEVAEAEISIGECEGYLEEIAQEDGYSSYDEYCEYELTDYENYLYSDGGCTYYDYYDHI